MDDVDQIRAAFKLICKKCGSDDIGIRIEEARVNWGGEADSMTGPGCITLGCNACKKNDLRVDV